MSIINKYRIMWWLCVPILSVWGAYLVMQRPIFIQNRIMVGLIVLILGMSAIAKLLDWNIKRREIIHQEKMRKLKEEDSQSKVIIGGE